MVKNASRQNPQVPIQSPGLKENGNFALHFHPSREKNFLLRKEFLLLVTVLSLFVQCSLNTALAQYADGPTSLGTGRTGRSANDRYESHWMNPASIPHADAVSGGLYYLDGTRGVNEHETGLAASVVENDPRNLFSGAITYMQRRRSIPSLPLSDESYWHVSLANFVYDHVSLGVSLHWLRQKLKDDPADYDQKNGTLGVLWNPDEKLALGAVYYHLVSPSSKIPEPLRLQKKASLSMTYLFSTFLRIRWDESFVLQKWQNQSSPYIHAVGLETISVANYLVFRTGFERNEAEDRSYISVGLGFAGPKMRLNYGFLKNTRGVSSSMHGVDLGVLF